MRHVLVPAVRAGSATTAYACAVLVCVAVLCARCVCSAIVRTYMHGRYDRTTPPYAFAHTTGVRTPSAALLYTLTPCAHAPCAHAPCTETTIVHMLLRCCDVRACRLILCALPHRVLAPCIRVRCAGTGMSTRAAPRRAPRDRALREGHNRRRCCCAAAMCDLVLCTHAQRALAASIWVHSVWAGIGTRASPRRAAAAHAWTTKSPSFPSSRNCRSSSSSHIARATCAQTGANSGHLKTAMRCA